LTAFVRWGTSAPRFADYFCEGPEADIHRGEVRSAAAAVDDVRSQETRRRCGHPGRGSDCPFL